ncbi:hypothetical protein G7009_01510 [Pseudomonas capeferrum]|uniref:hypothetical protein n=1 Tax=Pseudomonas capeferrum TaxID=1495066 RepID=UPI0015E32469|nr:hypothetical protein [Pseudomonas capeferrum]MBA1200480.1 hypothetical protein [Pseudomonas capeferrum]
MSHQFRPGDLALTLVDDVEIPAYSVVTIESRLLKGQELMDSDAFAFLAPSDGWFVTHPAIEDELAYGEKELMPLRGDFEPEQQKAKEACHG